MLSRETLERQREERHQEELMQCGREIIDRVRQCTNHVTEGEAERLIDEAITAYRRGEAQTAVLK